MVGPPPAPVDSFLRGNVVDENILREIIVNEFWPPHLRDSLMQIHLFIPIVLFGGYPSQVVAPR